MARHAYPGTKSANIESEASAVAEDSAAVRARLPRDLGGDAILSIPLVAELPRLVREGLPIDTACRVAGLRRTTLATWIHRGQADIETGQDTLASQLVWALDAAMGDQERALVRLAVRGADKNPELALSMLAIRHADRWAPAQPKVEDIRDKFANMSEEDVRREVARLLQPKGSSDVKPDSNPEPPLVADGRTVVDERADPARSGNPLQ